MLASFCLGNRGIGSKRILTYPQGNFPTTPIKEEPRPSDFLMNRKEILQEVKKKKEVHFSLVGKPMVILTTTNLDYFPIEVKGILDEFTNIIVDELLNAFPLLISIGHHIDLIHGSSLPNK
jgi:hypothetical protein